MNSFLWHVVFVILCIGAGVAGKVAWDNMRAMDAQVQRLSAELEKTARVDAKTEMLPAAMPSVKLAADPAKLAELKKSILK